MNRAVTLMVSTSGNRGFRQIVLSPVTLWLGAGAMIIALGAGIFGAIHVYQTYAKAREIRSDYVALQEGNARLTEDYAQLEKKVLQIEALEASIRKVIGLPSEEATIAGSATSGLGGGGQALDWHGLVLDNPTEYEETARVTGANERSEAMPLSGAEAADRAERLLSGLSQIDSAASGEQRDMAMTPTITPLKEGEPHWISSNFGVRVGPFTGRYEFHSGLDISAAEGAPVVAAADGEIVAMWPVSEGGGLGNAIKIRHGSQFETIYGHLRRDTPFAAGLRVGSRVRRNQIIGYVGGTGRATSPHLHYEVHHKGVRVNPLRFLLDR